MSTELKSDVQKPKINQHRLIVCEGYEDRAFFMRLMDVFDVPRCDVVSAGGKDKIGGCMSAYQLDYPGKWHSLRDVIIVGDNDDDPDERFKTICKQIDHVFDGVVAPSNELEASATHPKVVVMMVPLSKEHGCLEALCIEPAKADKESAKQVETFLANVVAAEWKSETRKKKAWLRAFLAVCASDPFVALGDALTEPKNAHLIPISTKNANLKKIADALSASY